MSTAVKDLRSVTAGRHLPPFADVGATHGNDPALAAVHHETARVVAAGPDGLRVRTASGVYEASVALSCVYQPEVDDEVVLAVPSRGALYVVTVLRRPSDRPLRAICDRALSFVVAEGFSVVAGESVSLQATKALELGADELGVRARRGSIFFEALESFAGSVSSEAGRVRRVLGTLDTFVERVTERIGRSHRVVEGLDAHRAGQLDLRAESTLTARGRHTVVSAEELVKVDGEQIHLG